MQLSLIGREKMKESLAYQEILEEGRMDARRSDIVMVIEERFGKRAASGFRSTLNVIEDAEELNRLLRLASRCTRLDELRGSLSAT